MPEKSIRDKVIEIARQTKKVGEDDPRRIIHSLKVGLALTLVSLLYYFQPLYHSFGVSAMWAVMTVVVVFEFSVGATIGKGLNRGLATVVAGALGLGAQYLASKTGKIGEPILIGLFVFLQAGASTFVRFFPNVKARYDYGLLIFILTFSLVSISGFRTDEILDLVQKRLSTIFIGGCACVVVSILVYPVWAGEDLHNLVANNIEKLGNFLEGFGEEYFEETDSDSENKNGRSASLSEYGAVLNSKSNEETLANFATWEPGHGEFLYRHPWKQYLKIGTLTRQCAFRVEALNGYLNSEIKAPQEICEMVKEPCTKMSKECGNAMKKLALEIRTLTRPSAPNNPHIVTAKTAARDLKSLLKSDMFEDINLLQVISVAAVASLLIDVVICVEDIAESVNELALLAEFKSPKGKDQCMSASRQIVQEKDCPNHIIIPINETSPSPSPSILEQDSDDHQNNGKNSRMYT